MLSTDFHGNVKIEQCQDRLIIISVQHGNYKLIIANVYAPNNSADKIAFFRTLHNALADYSNHDVMILGDFNCVMNDTLDIVSGRPHARIEVERLNEVTSALGVYDAWIALHGEEKEFTWNRFSPFIARRLDYCFVTEGVLTYCVSCEHITALNTDHKAVVIELNNCHCTWPWLLAL